MFVVVGVGVVVGDMLLLLLLLLVVAAVGVVLIALAIVVGFKCFGRASCGCFGHLFDVVFNRPAQRTLWLWREP